MVITTNHKTDGLYLPKDDRRHYVTWSNLDKESFEVAYWRKLYAWYDHGGIEHVAAYLAGFDIADFDPKAPPPKTQAFWDIVDASRAPEDDQLADALDHIGNPDVTTLEEISRRADAELGVWLRDRRNNRLIHHRMEAAGYVAVRNPAEKEVDGRSAAEARRSTPKPRCPPAIASAPPTPSSKSVGINPGKPPFLPSAAFAMFVKFVICLMLPPLSLSSLSPYHYLQKFRQRGAREKRQRGNSRQITNFTNKTNEPSSGEGRD